MDPAHPELGTDSLSTGNPFPQKTIAKTQVTQFIERSPIVALICGSLIMLFSLGIRHAFGLFLKPVTVDQGWGRETFAFAIALQNLVWGASQPFAGMLADKFGAKKIIAIGALFYSVGLWAMSFVSGEISFIICAGVLIGLGQSGTTFPVIFGAISRLVPAEQRSLAMGITMSIGSFGQFAMLPISLGLIGWLDWQLALVVLSIIALAMFPLAFGVVESPMTSSSAGTGSGAMDAMKEAFSVRDFWLLSLGFFVCGFQLAFIAIHLPAFFADEGLDVIVATTVLALIGLGNIVGTYYAGLWGGRNRKSMLLSWIYIGRVAVIAGFILIPITAISAYIFGILMGLFWLSTVPLTNGIVASVWGVRHMSMLGGFVFFAHQLGSFAGGWLGGWLYDTTGSYDIAWMIAIGLSLIASILNWPITERSMKNRKALMA